ETPLALAMQHVQAPVPDIGQFRGDVPPTLQELLNRLLAKQPQGRPSSPAEVLNLLRSGRHGDLQRDWPDQTVPFPGVATSNSSGPLQATMALQAKLRPKSVRSSRKLLPLLATIAFLTTSFGIGAMLAFSTPLRLFESQEEFYWDIAKQADAESQYRWALLNIDGSQLAKWEAVEHFFPKQDAPLNRLYAGLASLQLARAQFDRKDPESARKALMSTLDDREMSKIVRALAYLQLAEIATAAGKMEERDAAMQQAVEIAATEEAIGSEDLKALDENVLLMDPAIQAIWDERRGL
ncbi:MAG: tetratricopeptide repeat protein, partial [Aureliella sp.]